MNFLKLKYKNIVLSSCAIMLATSTLPAYAQLSQQIEQVDPGRISEQYRENLRVPQVSQSVDIRPKALLNAPEGADNIRLKLSGIQIEGNNVYSSAELSSLYQNQIGNEITLTEVYRIANDIATKYRQDGYVLTQVIIPPQTIESGVPRIQVVEGYINKIVVQADGQTDAEVDLVRAHANQISKNQSALNIKDMERQLLLINDLPGVSARTIISPSEDTPGSADILIIVERDLFDALISVDNYGSRFLGQWSANGVVNLNSALGFNELITAQAVYAPGTGYELLHGGLGYEQPVGTHGTRVGGLVAVTDTDPGYTLQRFDVRGNAKIYSAYISHPFIRARNETLKGKISFDWRDVRSSNNVENTRRDHIRALRAQAQYDFLDNLFGPAANVLNVKISKGLNIFGASEQGDKNMSRNLADPQFTKAELEVQRLQRIMPSVNVKLAGKGQIASDALPSSEEFGAGGFFWGRGYDPSEIVGDDGLAGQVELQWNNPIAQPTGNILQHYQLYTFVDAGRVWNTDATTKDDRRQSLVSAGIGVRADLSHDIDVNAGVAFPLTRRVESVSSKDPRFYFSFSKRF